MKTLAELNEIRNRMKQELGSRETAGEGDTRVVVGMATCGIAAGARPVLTALMQEAAARNLANVKVTQAGCFGLCKLEPLVEITRPGEPKMSYTKVTPEMVPGIVDGLTGGAAFEEGAVKELSQTDFFKKQLRIALRNCGIINPESIDEYIAAGGYAALKKVLTEMKPQEVIDEVKASGLRGRGGGGFSAGMKWQFTRNAPGDVKYVLCNADEGDPGAFMDRSVSEGDPHAVLEAMAIAGYAVGAAQGYIYVRAEYPIAVQRLNTAVGQARERGLLGKALFGTGFSFDIDIRLGSGAFVCGEETALITSIEGYRGEPRPRPPFPAVKGLFGKPTLLNNVETYANITQIMLNGAKWFSSIGTEKSKGTKVFALGGNIVNTGLVEVPMGTTLREIIEDIGGGIPNGKKFKAAQTGGPSGGCIPAQLIDTQIDYDNLTAIGSMMGSGGLIVMDEDNCMVDIAKFFLDFTVEESCGKCTPCRIGNKRLMEILDKITGGNATLDDLDKLDKLSGYIKDASLCGLGQTAPNPVLSTLRYFRDEYEQHITEKTCKAKVCKALMKYVIIPEKCIGCTVCKRVCPTNAIEGELKKPHVIIQEKCIKCGACVEKCKPNAIIKH